MFCCGSFVLRFNSKLCPVSVVGDLSAVSCVDVSVFCPLSVQLMLAFLLLCSFAVSCPVGSFGGVGVFASTFSCVDASVFVLTSSWCLLSSCVNIVFCCCCCPLPVVLIWASFVDFLMCCCVDIGVFIVNF